MPRRETKVWTRGREFSWNMFDSSDWIFDIMRVRRAFLLMCAPSSLQLSWLCQSCQIRPDQGGSWLFFIIISWLLLGGTLIPYNLEADFSFLSFPVILTNNLVGFRSSQKIGGHRECLYFNSMFLVFWYMASPFPPTPIVLSLLILFNPSAARYLRKHNLNHQSNHMKYLTMHHMLTSWTPQGSVCCHLYLQQSLHLQV